MFLVDSGHIFFVDFFKGFPEKFWQENSAGIFLMDYIYCTANILYIQYIAHTI